MKASRVSITIIYLLIGLLSTAQSVPKKINPSQIEALSIHFPDEPILAYDIATEFVFKYDESTDKITINEKHIEYYASLSGKEEEVSSYNYFSSFSSIGNISGSKAEAFSKKMKIDGIFHHDMFSYHYYFDISDANKIYSFFH